MKKKIFDNSKILIKIEGKNVNNFLKYLKRFDIQIFKIKYLNYKNAFILINFQDYEKISRIKTTYSLTIEKYYGLLKIKKIILTKKIFLICSFFGILILFFLSNFIFEIEIIHSNNQLRELVKKELYLNDIKPFSFRKKFNELEEIEKKIIDLNKNKIEWIEIVRKGTKYIVKIQERKIGDEKCDDFPRHLVAKKSAIIKKIVFSNGEILKNVEEYVNKNDIIISGNIKINENIVDFVKASGKVFGEVWYNVNVEYPFTYYEEKISKKEKGVFSISFLNNKIFLSTFDKKNKYISKKTVLLRDNILPLYFSFDKYKEVKIIDEVYTVDEAVSKGIELAFKKIDFKLKLNEKILDYKLIEQENKKDKVVLKLFFSVYEDITKYLKIETE